MGQGGHIAVPTEYRRGGVVVVLGGEVVAVVVGGSAGPMVVGELV